MRDERSSSAEETVTRPAILNVAAGRFMPLDLDKFRPCHIINVDWMYSHGVDNMRDIEGRYSCWTTTEGRSDTVYCKIDIWEFLESFSQRFDHITIYTLEVLHYWTHGLTYFCSFLVQLFNICLVISGPTF